MLRAVVVITTKFTAILFQIWPRHVSDVIVTQKLNTSYDYVIIGAGSAGSVVASRLSENPNVSVLLIEAGGTDADQSFHVPSRLFENIFSKNNWLYPTQKPKYAHERRNPGAEELVHEGKVLGGGASINVLQYTRGSKHDYDTWEQNGCKGWSYKDVLHYFKKSEDVQFNADPKYHSTGGFLGVSVSPYDEAFHHLCNAGNEVSLEETDHNSDTDLGVSKYYGTIKNGVRSSPSIHILREAMTRPNLHVTVNTFTRKVVVEEGMVTGVEIDNGDKTEIIKSRRETIVSAGALGSPKLLMLSGIGPRLELEKHGIPVNMDLPVGLNLKFHPSFPVWISTNRSNFAYTIPKFTDKVEYMLFKTGMLSDSVFGGGVIFTRMDKQKTGSPHAQLDMITMPTLPDLFGIQNHPHLLKGPGFSFLCFISHPKSVGSVKLRSESPYDNPLIDLNYFADDDDMKIGISTIRFIQKLIDTKSMASINASIDMSRLKYCEHAAFDSDEYWDCYLRLSVISYHHAGTCKMGAEDDTTAVVDPTLKVKGIKGLRVVDASIMPTETSGNSNAPVIMVAEKAADMIIQDYSELNNPL